MSAIGRSDTDAHVGALRVTAKQIRTHVGAPTPTPPRIA
jgi:hypothetical protein